MDAARIAELLEPFLGPASDQRLTTNDLDKVSTYIDLLLRWNARINLTAIRDPDEIVQRHFGESFFMARHLFPAHKRPEAAPPFASSAKGGITAPESPLGGQSPATSHQPLPTVIDLGSGAGFPALPLKIWAPEIHLALIESNHKKAAFLREVVRALELTGVDVVAARAESLVSQPTPFPPADIVTFRAVEKFDRILPLAASLLSPRGRLALLVGSTQLQALQALPLKWSTLHVPKSHNRELAVGAIQQEL